VGATAEEFKGISKAQPANPPRSLTTLYFSFRKTIKRARPALTAHFFFNFIKLPGNASRGYRFGRAEILNRQGIEN